ncbi:hypothetical protein BJ165DRAFT_1529669 [Panaeolus papilionaceus]|nr:hypothetical protein BJ165DRAFT_1529669 [Panaeolus papilionaceus]
MSNPSTNFDSDLHPATQPSQEYLPGLESRDRTMMDLDKLDYMSDPKFLAYTISNDLPPPYILTELMKARSVPLKELHELQGRIRVQELTLTALKRRYDDINRALSIHEPILAPIRRLPDDMLEEIFYHCLPTTRNPRPFVSESPLLLTLVCKRWRYIALASPPLWSMLHLPVPFDYIPPLERYNPLLDQMKPSPYRRHPRISELQAIRHVELDKWLTRSGSLPMSISLFASHAVNFPDYFASSRSLCRQDQTYAEQTLNVVVRHASRLSKLDIVMPFEMLQAFDGALAITDHNCSQLRRLRVSSRLAGGSQMQHLKLLSLKSIRELSLDLCAFSTNIAQPNKYSPWSTHIVELTLHLFLHPTVVLQILGLCSSLQKCSVSLYDKNSPGQYTGISELNPTEISCPTYVQLPALQTLSLQGLLVEMGAVCQCLNTPNLARIMLYPHKRTAPWIPYYDEDATDEQPLEPEFEIDAYPPGDAESLLSSLSEFKSIRSLFINPAYLTSPEAQAIFNALPQIEMLVFDNEWTHRPGAKMTSTNTVSSTVLGDFHYTLHPLLAQERVFKMTGERVPLDEPLLPNLTSFSWNQFSTIISNELLLSFLKSRIHPKPDTHNHSTKSLTEIDIKLITASDIDIEAELTRHIEEAGLHLGVDVALRVATYPWVKRLLEQNRFQYIAPKVSWSAALSKVSEDNLIFDDDSTWPFVDI